MVGGCDGRTRWGDGPAMSSRAACTPAQSVRVAGCGMQGGAGEGAGSM